jgi:hypothetical protein
MISTNLTIIEHHRPDPHKIDFARQVYGDAWSATNTSLG